MNLGEYFLTYGHIFVMDLPDNTKYPCTTDHGCLILSSLVHQVTSNLASGKSWNGEFSELSFILNDDVLLLREPPMFHATDDSIVNDLLKLATIIRRYFNLNGDMTPFIPHLLTLLESYVPVGDKLEENFRFAIDHHVALMPTKNRVCLINEVTILKDTLPQPAKTKFEDVVKKWRIVSPVLVTSDWHNSTTANSALGEMHTYCDKNNLRKYRRTNDDALIFMRNTVKHGSRNIGGCRLYDKKEGLEVLLYLHFGDFLAQLMCGFYVLSVDPASREYFQLVPGMMSRGLLRPKQSSMLSILY